MPWNARAAFRTQSAGFLPTLYVRSIARSFDLSTFHAYVEVETQTRQCLYTWWCAFRFRGRCFFTHVVSEEGACLSSQPASRPPPYSPPFPSSFVRRAHVAIACAPRSCDLRREWRRRTPPPSPGLDPRTSMHHGGGSYRIRFLSKEGTRAWCVEETDRWVFRVQTRRLIGTDRSV